MSDNVFTIHKVVIPCKINETINLFPFGDVHYGSPLFSKERWREFLDYAKKEKNTYFLGMGDFTDLLSYTERQIMGRGLHESTTQTIDDLYDRIVKDFCKDVAPVMQGRIIGMADQNWSKTDSLPGVYEAHPAHVQAFLRGAYGPASRGDHNEQIPRPFQPFHDPTLHPHGQGFRAQNLQKYRPEIGINITNLAIQKK